MGSVELYGVSIPSAELGGNVVDAVLLSDGSVFAYVADVSGHGLPAGILMGMIKTAVGTQLVDFPTPTAVFERLNEVLPHGEGAADVRDMHSSAHSACQEGLGLPRRLCHLSTCHANGLREWVGNRLADEQLPPGLLTGPPYRGQCIELRPGDVLLVATDGILEAAGPSGEEFGLAS